MGYGSVMKRNSGRREALTYTLPLSWVETRIARRRTIEGDESRRLARDMQNTMKMEISHVILRAKMHWRFFSFFRVVESFNQVVVHIFKRGWYTLGLQIQHTYQTLTLTYLLQVSWNHDSKRSCNEDSELLVLQIDERRPTAAIWAILMDCMASW